MFLIISFVGYKSFALALDSLEIKFGDRLLHLLITFNFGPIVGQIKHPWMKIVLLNMVNFIFLGMQEVYEI